MEILTAEHATVAVPQSIAATIKDDDPPPQVAITVDQPVLVEGDGSVTLTATLSSISSQPIQVNATFGGDAVAGTDYQRTDSVLTISAGSRQGTIQITAIPDDLDESAEQLQIGVLSIINGVGTGVQQAEIVIIDSITSIGTVAGQTFHDLESNSVRNFSEPLLNDWTVQLFDSSGTIVAVQRTGNRDLNADGQVDPATEHGWYSFRVRPGDYTIRQVAPAGWRQTAPFDRLAKLAFEVDQELDFRTTGQFWENWGGAGEKWLQRHTDSDAWYYLTTSGGLYRWDQVSGVSLGNALNGTFIVQLGPSFHADPTLLIDVVNPRAAHQLNVLPGSVATDLDFGNLELASIRGRKFYDRNANGSRDENEEYLNGWLVELSNSRGEVIASQLTEDRDLNQDGQIDPLTEQGWYSFQGLNPGNYSVKSVPQDGWQLTAPIDTVAQLAWTVGQQLDFFSTGNFWENFAGENERWLQSAANGGRWYYVTTAGQLREWDGVSGPQNSTPLSGILVATLDSRYHAEPRLLIDAAAELGVHRITVFAGAQFIGVDIGSVRLG